VHPHGPNPELEGHDRRQQSPAIAGEPTLVIAAVGELTVLSRDTVRKECLVAARRPT
jgi:hypothetical protein